MTRRQLFLAGAASPLFAQKTEAELLKKVRKELLTLPYYGCFDLLSFKLEGRTLKDDAERVLKSIERIEKIENEIEVLPLSPSDDQIRWSVFGAIYRDPSLSRYAPGGGVVGPFNRNFGGAFFGGPFERWNMPAGTLQPLGTFPIHIIVKNGNVILVGVVDNKADSDRANILANGIAGVFSVKNVIEVSRSTKK